MEWIGDVLAFIKVGNSPLFNNMMNLGIKIEIDWFDDDVICLRFQSSNGRFSGENALYVTHSDLCDMGKTLQGFPQSPTDYRDLELGTFIPTNAGGGVKLHFSCIDKAGHAKVDIKLRADGCKNLGDLDSVSFSIPVEPAAIDFFVSQIMNMEIYIGNSVELQMAT
jgi:hypothetical protein